jgi:hypothetical protein
MENELHQDSPGGTARAVDFIKWIVVKGDLIAANENLHAEVKVTKAMPIVGKKVGTLTVVTSTGEADGSPPTNLLQDATSTLFSRRSC